MAVSQPAYSIGAIGRMLGIPTATLRAWEERYGVVRPERSPGGQRLYSREQAEQLAFVQNLLRHGMSAADAHRVLRERVADGGAVVQDAHGGASVLILLAEQDRFGADLAKYFLQTEGCDVVLAIDADEVERLYRERRPAVVVLDLMISAGRGIDVCRRLSQDGARVIAMSVLGQRARALDAGADVFLRKPVQPLQLVTAVRDVVGTSALSALRQQVARP